MAKKPVLVLQFRRLGDVILTFPLVDDLKRIYAGHQIMLGVQPAIRSAVKQIYKNITVISPDDLTQILRVPFEAIINSGSDESSSLFSEKASANLKLGKLQKNRETFINGYWHLYRESLTLNNRHNTFHWGDLFRMDLSPHLQSNPISLKGAGTGRIGFFVGASDPLKRPDPEFWVSLTRKIADAGLKPVLLGGPGEAETGKKIIGMRAPAVNMCGKTTLPQLAELLKSLDMLITPDTGPMHLANYLAIPVLNLSMGNVNPAETGPYANNQHILRAHMSCSGCWRCDRPRPYCRQYFQPKLIAEYILAVHSQQITKSHMGLDYLLTARDDKGFYTLVEKRENARTALDQFWRAAFMEFNNKENTGILKEKGLYLLSRFPGIGASLKNCLGKLFLQLTRHRKNSTRLPDDFWRGFPYHLRLFAGFTHMALQNDNYSSKGFTDALTRLDSVRAVL